MEFLRNEAEDEVSSQFDTNESPETPTDNSPNKNISRHMWEVEKSLLVGKNKGMAYLFKGILGNVHCHA